MFTILEHGKQFKGLKMAIIGDILYSRVARSNIAAWTKLGADVHVAGPMTLIPHDIQELGVTVHKRWKTPLKGRMWWMCCGSSWNARTRPCSPPPGNTPGSMGSTKNG